MSMWREGRKGRGRGRIWVGEQGCNRARDKRARRQEREEGQAAPFIVSGRWGGAYLAIAR